MINKIDNDHYEFVTETKTTVSLKELEQELANLEKMNEELAEFNSWRETLPENRQEFIEEKYSIPTDELLGKIAEIKEWQEA